MYILLNLLFFVSANCFLTTIHDSKEQSPILLSSNDNLFEIRDRDIFRRRFKREINVEKNTDETYSLNVKKDVKIDDGKTVELTGLIDGIKPGGGFKDINAGVGYIDKLNKKLGLFAEHSYDGDTKLSAKGNLNIFDTSGKKLDTSGFIEKAFSNSDVYTKYGGALDLSTRGGSGASVSILHDSKVGDLLNANGKLNLFKDNGKSLDLQGSWIKTSPLAGLGPVSDLYRGSINYANRNGNSASIAAAHLPEFGDKLSATGQFSLFHNEDHDLDASGTFTRNFPINKDMANFNTYSGKLDYNYRDKLGLGLEVDHNDIGKRTDLSALANLNLFRDKDTSFDFNAGVRKTLSPTYSSPYDPFFGITFKKSF